MRSRKSEIVRIGKLLDKEYTFDVKQNVLIGLLIVVILACGGFLVFVLVSPSQKIQSDEAVVIPTIQPVVSKKTKQYIDSAGFSFYYPDSVIVTKEETLDDSEYSVLKIASEDVSGELLIAVRDSLGNSLEEVVSKEEEKNPATKKKEVTFASFPSVELEYPSFWKLISYDQKIEFVLTVTPEENKEYWREVYEVILKQFAIVSSSQNTSDAGTTVQEPEYELEEEIIE